MVGAGVGWAYAHHLSRGWERERPRPMTRRTWGAKHVLQLFVAERGQGPRAVDLDDHQAPPSPDLGPLDNEPKMVIKNQWSS